MRATHPGRRRVLAGAALLFEATYDGAAVTIGHASEAELATLSGMIPTKARDGLDPWSLVAIREPGGDAFTMRALGWRVGLANTWITSALRCVDLAAGTVGTSSGHAYTLGGRDTNELHPELRRHLAYALRTWGYEDVRR